MYCSNPKPRNLIILGVVGKTVGDSQVGTEVGELKVHPKSKASWNPIRVHKKDKKWYRNPIPKVGATSQFDEFELSEFFCLCFSFAIDHTNEA